MARYRVNAPRFVDETVDGEALIMDMVTGKYYTCLGSATVAWEALKSGLDVGDVAAILSSAYPVETADAARDVESFVGELVQEQMLVLRDGDSDQSVNVPVPANGEHGGKYQPLRFESYADLADLILLDPVHDVSDVGWPHEPE